MLKADLRKLYLSRQRSFSPAQRLKKSEQISNQFFRQCQLNKVRFLHLFLAIEKNNEIETRLIYHRIWSDWPKIKTVVPRIRLASNELEAVEFNLRTRLSLDKWQIPEPVENNLVAEEQIDLVLVPLLSYDRKGFRVGYGKGYYDRFLAKCRPDCLKIGLSYFPPVKVISDINNLDVPLNVCLTPEKVWTF